MSQPKQLVSVASYFPDGIVHFVGIGGIGMSGIAEIMHGLGFAVQGSDIADNANVTRLRDMGLCVHIGHDGAHIAEARLVVISSAVQGDNAEVQAAQAAGIPIIRRAEMLAELMRLRPGLTIAGTHGKTTTTSLTAAVLDAAGLDPTVINGGIINAYGTNARPGSGDWMIVEADESDGTFIRLPSTIGIITNIDPEHLEHYGDFDGLRAAFRHYIDHIPFYGVAICCIDHPEVRALVAQISGRRILTYGQAEDAHLRAQNIRTQNRMSLFDVSVAAHAPLRQRPAAAQQIENLCLPMLGQHNVLNALAAIAAGLELGASPDKIRQGLADFSGVKRRFSEIGIWRGVTLIDDYAHHPVEIAAVLESARAACAEGGRVFAVAQPHRFSRLRDLFDDFTRCFTAADGVFLLPVYAAGEAPIDGVDSQALQAALAAQDFAPARLLAGREALAPTIAETARSGDMVVLMGAGSISQWGARLPEELAGLSEIAS